MKEADSPRSLGLGRERRRILFGGLLKAEAWESWNKIWKKRRKPVETR